MRNRMLNLFFANAKRGTVKAEGNTIFLYDFIVSSEEEAMWFGGVSAEGFAKMLAQMTGPVLVRINSPGGDVFGGRAMANAIRGYDGAVTVQVDGLAASAASTVAIAGDRVTIAPDAMLMIHEAWTLTMGNKRDHTATADLLSKIDQGIAESYAAKAGGDVADWAARMEAESWFTATEAADLGLIDEIMPTNPAKSSNAIQWDLSAFTSAPAPARSEPEPEPIAEQQAEEQPQIDQAEPDQIAARQRKLAVALL